MKLVKDGVSVELTNEIQIRAYLNSGYTEAEESAEIEEIPEAEESADSSKQKKRGAKGNGTA